MTDRGRNGGCPTGRRSRSVPPSRRPAMALLDDVITYLEMRQRPNLPRVHPAPVKLALIQAEQCTVSFYRYLYETVGTPWLWYERRLLDDAALAAEIRKPTTEIFVLYVRGVPA